MIVCLMFYTPVCRFCDVFFVEVPFCYTAKLSFQRDCEDDH